MLRPIVYFRCVAEPPPPIPLADSAMRAVRRRFEQVGWTETAAASRLGLESLAALGAAAPLGESARDPIGLLCRVFLTDETVPVDALAPVLGVRAIDGLERMQLLELRDGRLACPLNLFPCRGLYLATDKRGLHPAYNQVMWLYPECWHLARLAVRRRARRVLDLGTGSGIHALLARRFADEVVGVDTNARAIAFAEANRAFNGVERVAFLRGDLYRPLMDLPQSARRFGLILANPPYHPVLDSKAGDNAYSGGETGEEVFEAIVRGLREHLGVGGFCQIITLFIHREGKSWRDKVRRWLRQRGDGFEVLLMSAPVAYPSELQSELVRLRKQDPRSVELSWKAQRITGFRFGLLTVRRARSARGFYVEGPYRPATTVPLDDLLRKVARARGERRRALVASLLSR